MNFHLFTGYLMHLILLSFLLVTTFCQCTHGDPIGIIENVETKQKCNLLKTIFFPIGTGGPSVVAEGKDALLTCVIMGPSSNDTVLWKKGNSTILSAGMNRVTKDKRISILHDESKYQFNIMLFVCYIYLHKSRCLFQGRTV